MMMPKVNQVYSNSDIFGNAFNNAAENRFANMLKHAINVANANFIGRVNNPILYKRNVMMSITGISDFLLRNKYVLQVGKASISWINDDSSIYSGFRVIIKVDYVNLSGENKKMEHIINSNNDDLVDMAIKRFKIELDKIMLKYK